MFVDAQEMLVERPSISPAGAGPDGLLPRRRCKDFAAAGLRKQGFAYLGATQLAPLLISHGLKDWSGFASSWDDLVLDVHMADGGTYRRRRHANFRITSYRIERKAHQPHFQSRQYNKLNGGAARWSEPISTSIGTHSALEAILCAAHILFDGMLPFVSWPTELQVWR